MVAGSEATLVERKYSVFDQGPRNLDYASR